MPYILLFILSLGAFNAIYATFAVSAVVAVGYQFHRVRGLYFNALNKPALALLMLFGVSFAIFSGSTTLIQYTFYYLVIPVMVYWAGWVSAECGKENPDVVFKKTVYVIALALGIHAALNISVNIGLNRWLLTDFFSGEITAATGSGSINTIIFSATTYWIFVEKRKVIKLIAVFLTAISLAYGLLLGTRTQFIILVFTFMFCTFICFILRERVKGAFRFAAICGIILIILVVLYSNNVYGVRTLVESSNLGERLNAMSTGGLDKADSYRTSSILRGLANLFIFPFGGLANESYYHNTWLDVGRVSGIIPFLAWLFYTIIEFHHVWILVKDKSIDEGYRMLLLGTYTGVYLNLFVEPGMEGFRWFIYLFLWLNGLVDYTYYRKRRLSY